jgi:hypothetical protein
MAREVQVRYRAQARCGCDWKGERHTGTRREPAGSLAYADAAVHREQGGGHASARVEAWWVGRCAGCKVSSERLQRAEQAWAWVDAHQASDPKHLRRQQERQDLEGIADRILGAIRF